MRKRKVEIWFQPGPQEKIFDEDRSEGELEDMNIKNRIRLVTAQGDSRFYSEEYEPEAEYQLKKGLSCCWDNHYYESFRKKLSKMHKFDKESGFPRAIKIGEFWENED